MTLVVLHTSTPAFRDAQAAETSIFELHFSSAEVDLNSCSSLHLIVTFARVGGVKEVQEIFNTSGGFPWCAAVYIVPNVTHLKKRWDNYCFCH